MWNYRIFKSKVNDREYYCLKEAFYDDNKNIISWTEGTETGYFEDVDQMLQTHELMLQDIKKYKKLIVDEEETLKGLEDSS